MASWVQGTPRVYRTCCVLFSGERVQSLKQILRWGRVPKEAESPYSRQLRGVWRGPGGSRGRGPLTHASPASSDTQTSKCSPFLTSPHHRPVARAAWSWERARPCGVTGPPPPTAAPAFRGKTGRTCPPTAGRWWAQSGLVSCLGPPGLSGRTPTQGEAGSLGDLAPGGTILLGCNFLGSRAFRDTCCVLERGPLHPERSHQASWSGWSAGS